MKVSCVVRVGTSNNFNCTAAEFRQLDVVASEHPDYRFFVNSNARTPKLPALIDHPYKAVITLNPDLTPEARLTERALKVGRAGSVAFYRVKWLPDREDIPELVVEAQAVAPVVVTMQRFNSHATMERFGVDKACYAHECSRFRLHGEALEYLYEFVGERAGPGRHPVHICDKKGLGCLGCGLCATLNGAKGTEIKSLNLSTSGLCPYSCPDCYAKAMQKFLLATGANPVRFDTIMKNKKQAGKTKHIQNARRAA
jgi:hypothetical protein